MTALPILADGLYRPLKHNEIRVLELLLGDKAAPILCHLRHVEIEYYDEFEAVSYTWGNEQYSRSIRFKSGTLAITPSLEAALRVFRHPVPGALGWAFEHVRRFFGSDSWRHTLIPGTSYLWIDAICINQEDLDERNRQIKVMGEIYRRAKRLLIWLGVESNNSDVAMNFLSMAGETREMTDHIYVDWLRENAAQFQQIFESIMALLSRPCFTRAWILQEYVLGVDNSTLFYCGKRCLPRKNLSMELFDSLYERWENFNIAQDPTSQLTATEQHSHMAKVFQKRCWRLVSLMRSELKHELLVSNKEVSMKAAKSRRDPKLSIVYWLELDRRCRATDPRDKVYSILGLVSR